MQSTYPLNSLYAAHLARAAQWRRTEMERGAQQINRLYRGHRARAKCKYMRLERRALLRAAQYEFRLKVAVFGQRRLCVRAFSACVRVCACVCALCARMRGKTNTLCRG